MANITIEQFRHVYDERQHTGLTVYQFSENIGIRELRFYYWKAKLKAESLPAACGGFIPVKMTGKSGNVYTAVNNGGKALCEVVYPNGVMVRVTSDMSLDQLRQMVTLLR